MTASYAIDLVNMETTVVVFLTENQTVGVRHDYFWLGHTLLLVPRVLKTVVHH